MGRKPIKRNEHIVPLSRDHHEGLLLCWKLRKGVQEGIAPYRMWRYVAWFWDQHLTEHFREEEELLFTKVSHPDADRALDEHRQIKRQVDDITRGVTEAPTAFTALADLIDRHIRFEERELFPLLEELLSPEQLAAIGHELAALHGHQQTPRYGDEFWVAVK